MGNVTTITLATGARGVFIQQNTLVKHQSVHFVETPGQPPMPRRAKPSVWALPGCQFRRTPPTTDLLRQPHTRGTCMQAKKTLRFALGRQPFWRSVPDQDNYLQWYPLRHLHSTNFHSPPICTSTWEAPLRQFSRCPAKPAIVPSLGVQLARMACSAPGLDNRVGRAISDTTSGEFKPRSLGPQGGPSSHSSVLPGLIHRLVIDWGSFLLIGPGLSLA